MSTPDSTDAQPPWLSAGEWHLVPARSQLGFLTRIMFGLVPVRGRYSAYEGELHIDGAGNASGVLQVEAETISTGIKKRDKLERDRSRSISLPIVASPRTDARPT